MKDINGRVFGGYTDLEFDGSGAWKSDGQKNSFLFVLLDNKIIKCKCINNTYEIYKGHSSHLTIFGNSTL